MVGGKIVNTKDKDFELMDVTPYWSVMSEDDLMNLLPDDVKNWKAMTGSQDFMVLSTPFDRMFKNKFLQPEKYFYAP